MRTIVLTAAIAVAFLAWHAVSAEDLPESSAVNNPAPRHEQVTIMPQGFTSFGAAEHGGYLYMIGGHTTRAHRYDHEGFNRNFYRLNLRDRTSWEILPGGVALQSVALVSAGERLIRIGGMTALNAPGEPENLKSSNAVAAFDPLTNQWSDLPALPSVRSSHDAVAVGNRVYVFGGWQLEGESEDAPWHDSGLVLNLDDETPAWQPVPQPFTKRALALAYAGGHIVAVGGMTPEGTSSSVHLFNVEEQSWSEGPSLPGASRFGGFGSGAFGHDGRVYATNFDGELFSLAPGDEAWRREGTLTFPRFFHRLIHVGGGEFAVIAGSARGGHVRNIEWLKPGRPGPAITRIDIPAPGNAKVRQGIFVRDNWLYVFGGNNSVLDHQFAPENFLDEAFRISLNDLRAERIASFPLKRQSFITTVVDDGQRFSQPLGFAIGGFGHDGEAAITTADIFEYDFAADEWRDAGFKLPIPLTQFGQAEFEGKLYLFGGMDFDPARGRQRFQLSDRIYVWNPLAEESSARKQFTTLETAMPRKRRAFGGAVLDGKYYMVGGMTDRFEEVDPCDVYDFKTGEWSRIPQPSDVRISPKLIPLNGKLYLIGGSSPVESGGHARNPSIEVFDPATNEWSTLIEDIGVDLGELQAFAVGHRILLYSVHNTDNEIRLLFIEP
jgi:N-acetylneuraminic acid mutarotase